MCIAVDNPGVGVSALRATLNHTESMAPTRAPFQFVSSVGVEEFQPTFVPEGADQPNLINLLEGCGTIQANFSGSGICTCPHSGL